MIIIRGAGLDRSIVVFAEERQNECSRRLESGRGCKMRRKSN